MIKVSVGQGAAILAKLAAMSAQLADAVTAIGTKAANALATTTANGLMAATDKLKLGGIAAGATVNDSDANLKNRANHSGTQPADTITETAGLKLMTASERDKLARIAAGAQPNAVTTVAGRTGAIMLAKGDVGLGQVDNTPDAGKPVSTAAQQALDAKADTAALAGRSPVRVPLQTQGRPGDVVDRFTTALTGPAEAGSAPIGDIVATGDGKVLRLAGGNRVVLRERIALEGGRAIKVRALVRRITDTSDPLNDTVQIGIQPLGANGLSLGAPIALANVALHVADGGVEHGGTISDVAGLFVDQAWPANARIGSIYAMCFGGDDGVTDVIALDWEDVTEAVTARREAAAAIDALTTVAAQNSDAIDAVGVQAQAETAMRVASVKQIWQALFARDDAEPGSGMLVTLRGQMSALLTPITGTIAVLGQQIAATATSLGAQIVDVQNGAIARERTIVTDHSASLFACNARYYAETEVDTFDRRLLRVTRIADGASRLLIDNDDVMPVAIDAADRVIFDRRLTSGAPWTRWATSAEGGRIVPFHATSSVYAIGDSQTQREPGGPGTGLAARMAQLLGTTAINDGLGGQTTTQIAARFNATPVTITIAGNVIPAGVTPVSVTVSIDLLFQALEPDTSRPISVAGVHGTLLRRSGAIYTFTRDVAGAAVAVPANTLITMDLQGRDEMTMVLGDGRNDGDYTPTAAMQDAILAKQVSVVPRAIVRGISTKSDGTEASGSAGYAAIVAFNAARLAALGPAKFLDERAYLIAYGLVDAGLPTTADDATDLGRDNIPRSLLDPDDRLHYLAVAIDLIARQIILMMDDNGWLPARIVVATSNADARAKGVPVNGLWRQAIAGRRGRLFVAF